MITPCGQARRTVCQPQPASTRSSRPSAGRLTAAQVARARAAAAVVGGTSERAEAGVAGAAAVVEPGVGEVDDPAARGAQAQQPVLLVAVRAVEALVELADPLHRGAPDGEVRAPHHLGLHVLRAQVERRDRRVLAAAAARRVALEAGADRPAERLGVRMPLGALHERVQPARRHEHVVVHERDQRRRRLAQAGVARGVQAAALAVADQSHAVRSATSRGRVGGPVVHDEELMGGPRALAAQRLEGHLEIRQRARVVGTTTVTAGESIGWIA